jgi:signal transduction histidine kinase
MPAVARWADRHVLAITFVVSAAYFVPGELIGASWANGLPGVLIFVPVLLAFAVGARCELPASLVGLLATSLAASAGDLASSVVSMWVFTAPGWVIGRVMRSRVELRRQLEQRARELELERESFAEQSVRYERAKIARDLHDIVAHNLSMIVVQAGAGRRAVAADPAIAAESLRHIEGSAHRAEQEIDQLVGLLAREQDEHIGNLNDLDELIRRAAETGLDISYAFSGSSGRLPNVVTEVAYRVAQEGITNALKHAPGAPIRVSLETHSARLAISIENEPPPSATNDGRLASTGGGYGLEGLKQRIRILNGSFDAGPTETGGWRVLTELPLAA